MYLHSVLEKMSKRYDIIHCQFGHLAERFSFTKELWRAKFVVTFRGFDWSALPRVHGKGMYARTFETADAVIVGSEHGRARVINLGCPPYKIVKHHSGTDVGMFSFKNRRREPDRAVRILTVARLVEKKGIEYAIRAVAQSMQCCSRAFLYRIVGDGPMASKLKQLIAALGYEGRIELLGWRTHKQVRDLMHDSHIFLLPSITARNGDEEGIPGSIREAMATGMPVIATLHGGIPELVKDGESGFLVPEGDVEGLAKRINHLLEHPGCWSKIGLAGRRRVEAHFDAYKLNEQLAELYTRLLSRHIPREFDLRIDRDRKSS
jgi:colanic acid/amylovoran biosynthesis glycosyltransferase